MRHKSGYVCLYTLVGLALFASSVVALSSPTNEDPDHDGFSTKYETAIGTDPLDLNSRPTLSDDHWKILAYWPLMTNAVEAFESGIDGVLANGACFKKHALKLDGRDDYVNFGNDSRLSITNSISFCVWLKPKGSNRQGRDRMKKVVGKFTSRHNNREYAAFLGWHDRLWTFFSDNGTAKRGHGLLKTTRCPRVVRNNKWNHIAVTWDTFQGADGVKAYVGAVSLPLCAALPHIT